ncbi:MAG TPA: hypothetical protein VN922_00255 [Bacteroidia bacterium]|nr:hypothetical protein [Bacteroidia bacterium]
MIIDTKGRINIQNFGLEITPEFTLDDLRSNSHFADFRFGGRNDGYERYSILNALIENLPFFVFLIFSENKISRIHLSYTELIPKQSHENVEEYKAQVDLTKEKHDEWLFKEHGTLSPTYSWGSINSYLDTRFTYTANIVVIYTQPKMNILRRILNKS